MCDLSCTCVNALNLYQESACGKDIRGFIQITSLRRQSSLQPVKLLAAYKTHHDFKHSILAMTLTVHL